jgi:hypothetical protein
MSTKITKKAKAKKSAKAKPKKAPPKKMDSGVYYRVYLELPELTASTGEMTYRYMEHHLSLKGTMDEEKAKALADEMKQIGQGGKLVEQDGTPDGKVLEIWGGVGRLEEASQEEDKNSSLTTL